MKRGILTTTVLLAALTSTGALAVKGVYKWTDEHGVVQYTEYKPAGVESIEVDAPPPPPSDAYDPNKAAAEQIRSAAEASENKKKQANKNKVSQNDAERRKKNCETARNNLKILENQRIVSYTDEYGDKIRMGDEQREANIRDAQKQIEFFCD